MNSQAVPESAVPVNRFQGEGAYACMSVVPPLPPINVARLKAARWLSDELLRLAVAVWRQRGLALIDPLVLGGDDARREVVDAANQLYGRRSRLTAEAE